MECSQCHKTTSTVPDESKYDVQWKQIDGKWVCGECLKTDKKDTVEPAKHSTNSPMQANAQIAKKLLKAIKPWIVRRPNAGCQVLFPLTELDNIIDEATSA